MKEVFGEIKKWDGRIFVRSVFCKTEADVQMALDLPDWHTPPEAKMISPEKEGLFELMVKHAGLMPSSPPANPAPKN